MTLSVPLNRYESKDIVLSVIIPSYKDPLLHKTIDSLLDNSALGEQLEIIPVLDGYWPELAIRDDTRIRVVHTEENWGMRDAINLGVSMSNGAYIMRTDEHCMFAEQYDRILLESIEQNWIVTPRRYFLNPQKWEVMNKGCVDYEKLIIHPDYYKFTGQKWRKRTRDRADMMIDETMIFQGSCWVMARSWWDNVIGRLQTEGYGPHYSDQIEMAFKTWEAGGKLMVNKNTWFAHRDRNFNRTHHYPIEKARKEWEFAVHYWWDEYQKKVYEWNI